MMRDPGEAIGDLAMRFAELLRDEYGDDVKVGAVAVIADVHAGDGDDPVNPIVFSCSDPRKWVQAALLAEAADRADVGNAVRETEAHPDDPAD